MRSTSLVLLAGLLSLLSHPDLGAQRSIAEIGTIARAEAPPPGSPSLLTLPARLRVHEVPLVAAFTELQRASGIHLAFSPTLLPPGVRVSCDCERVTVGEALARMLDSTGFGFTDLGSQVLIEPQLPEVRRSMPNLAGRTTLQFASMDLTPATYAPRVSADRDLEGTLVGQVLDAATQRPLVGAQVFISSIERGTLTNAEGRFTIVGIPAGPVVVEVQMIGYGTQERTITIQDDLTTAANFDLQPQALSLDEVVVTGTGGFARVREVGTAISRMDAAQLATIPAVRPQDILAGRVAGVAINTGGGQPGNQGSIRLRGNNSISQGNQPLIYVDGVRIFSEHTPSGSATSSGGMLLNSISPNDIERIEIVKGAAASTLYGTEAAGGVIQIFTKQGFAGAPQWNAELGLGFDRVGFYGPNLNKDLNPTGLYMNECRGPDVLNYEGERVDDVTCPESGSWVKLGPRENLALSVRGGAGEVAYYVAGHLDVSESTAPQGWGRTGGFRGNLSFHPVDDVELSWSNAYTRSIYRFLPEGGGIESFIGQVTRGPGISYRIDGEPAGGLLLKNQTYDWTDHYLTGFTARYDQTSQITHTFTAGYDYTLLTGHDLYEFGNGRYPEGRIRARDWRNTVLSLDYSGALTLGDPDRLSSTLSLGGQYIYNNNREVQSSSDDFAGPGAPTLSSGARREVEESRTRVITAGLFAQEVLGINNQLFLTAGIRFDGNSAFGENFGIQSYPKLSASYVISDNDFWPTNLIQNLRLRAAVGEAGKAPGAFDAVRTWEPVAADDGNPGFTPAHLGNPDLGPERTREVEMGFEASTLNGRLDLDFTWYRQNVSDALIPIQPAPSLGFLSSQLENIGRLRNTGIEFSADLGFIRNSFLDWSGRVTLATTHTTAVDLGGQTISLGSANEVREGLPVPVYVGPKVMNPDEYAMPIVEQNQVLGQVYPDRRIGLSTSISIRQALTLEVLGEFVQGGHNVYPQGEINARRFTFPPCFDIQHKWDAYNAGDTSALDDVTALWRARCGGAFNNEWADYAIWTDESDFFRLRTVSLTYQLPTGLVPGVNTASISVAGRNLFTRTDYIGVDPEENNNSGSSLARRGWSNWPTPQTFLLTMRVGF